MHSVRSVVLDAVELSSSPINPDWIIEGAPLARSGNWATSSDGTVTMAVWSCTAGTFRWQFTCDELIHIIEGSVEVKMSNGDQLLLGPNDSALFPAGEWTTWHVPEYVRKHAILRSPVPRPVRVFWRILSRLKATLRGRAANADHASAL